jgi:two-component system, OmpR family, phosphate regulon sensor histidine kinase PhoR
MIINDRTAQIMRLAGLLVPIFLLSYGIFVQYGVADKTHYAGDLFFYSLMIPWFITAVAEFLFPAKTRAGAGVWFLIYHIFASLYIILVTGFSSPFAITWVLLVLASYAYFSNIGLWFSVITLALTVIINSYLHFDNISILITNIIAATVIMVISLTAVSVSRIQEIDGAELSRSKALENLQRDRIMTIVNNLADAVLSTDQNGIIRVYNAASLNLLDTNTSLNGHFIDEVLTLYDKEDQPVSLYETFKKSRGVMIRDDLTMTVEGESLRIELTYSPIHSSYGQTPREQAQDGFIVIMRDVTKTKSLEEERDEFISVVSHELRTPITIAEGTISNVQLMMERTDIKPDILQEGLKTAHDQVIFLSKMVNDLSTLSRAERGVSDEPESIIIRDVVNELYHEYAPQANAKGLQFNLDAEARLGKVKVSKLYLKELLQNFMTNSIKYTKTGSITFHVFHKGNKVVFEVRDTGIGISKSDQAKIFHRFYRSEDYRTRETGGTGLGLYVATKLAKKLGTKIDMTSRLNHGSSFSIALPVEES